MLSDPYFKNGTQQLESFGADLNRLWVGLTPAVANGEVCEVDVVAVHELGETGSQEQENLGVCEAQKQRHGNSLKREQLMLRHI